MSQVVLVDHHDHVLGTLEKLKAHELGVLHRAFSILLYRKVNGVFEVLLQRRHPDKYHCGGLWANTCCSHPMPGEDLFDAAVRRLNEELHLEVPLQWIGSFVYRAELENGLVEHEFDHVFLGEYEGEAPRGNPLEVIDVRWIPLMDVQADLNKNPKAYVPWVSSVLSFFEKAHLKG
ncbi:MAG: isopentenyl-diphosphate Delta-isomerase [Gammaproteobacteria bacterium]|nr:isopentenyl-diphosphate Delta-isomerase [Gammaproteobacteria bacterium]